MVYNTNLTPSRVEQWLAHQAHNLKVGGSNPSPATNRVELKYVNLRVAPLLVVMNVKWFLTFSALIFNV